MLSKNKIGQIKRKKDNRKRQLQDIYKAIKLYYTVKRMNANKRPGANPEPFVYNMSKFYLIKTFFCPPLRLALATSTFFHRSRTNRALRPRYAKVLLNKNFFYLSITHANDVDTLLHRLETSTVCREDSCRS